jgi:hypothetical protein
MNKPTLVLYYKDNVQHFLAGAEDEKLLVKSYNETNLTNVLKESIEELKSFKDKRFNFFINPGLLTYLETTSKNLGLTKSNFIRNLIVDHMKKNKSQI